MFIAWTTIANRLDADRLAQEVVAQGLAACVQIDGPITSHYRWEGKTEKSEEYRLTFKTLPSTVAALEAWVLAQHTYDTPEWLVVRADKVGEKYLSWAEANSSTRTL